MLKKAILPSANFSKRQNRGRSFNILLLLTCIAFLGISFWHSCGEGVELPASEVCPQSEPFISKNKHLDDHFEKYLTSNRFQQGLLQRFAAAIRIPTVSYDSMRGGPGTHPIDDPSLYKPYLDFQKFLGAAYPMTNEALHLVFINKYSMLYHWKGTDESLKPGMLMSHIDVVPVDPGTVDKWIHSPFSGVVSDGRLYGRGASDTKLTLIGIMEAVESLLQAGFVPKRTMFLSFGHDEEISGFNGAAKIVEHLESAYKIGKNGIEFVSDEGNSVVPITPALVSFDGPEKLLAAVGVSEKGYVDFNVTVEMKKGGHASLPPDHTGIGILAQIITAIEAEPFPLFVFEENPVIGQMKCLGEHTDLLSSFQKFALNHLSVSLPYIYSWFSKVPLLKASISTTQSADIISGGVKVNAIPTSAFAVFNLRINPASSVQEISDRLIKMVEPIAKLHGLGLEHHQKILLNETEQVGKIILNFHGAIEPSPISPTNSPTFAKFSSVIRKVFENVTVSPGLMVNNNLN